MKQLHLLLALALVLNAALLTMAQTEAKLIFVIETFRHGARYPYSNSSFWNDTDQLPLLQQLSPTGMRQHYVFGQTLRQQYITGNQPYLSFNFNHSEIYIRSTHVNRTIQSALSHLQGLYPIPTGPLLPPNLSAIYTVPPFVNAEPETQLGPQTLPYQIQTNPIHMFPYESDPFLNAEGCCPNIPKIQADYQNTTTFQNQVNNINAVYNNLFKTLDSMLLPGSNVSFSSVDEVYDVLTSNTYNGYPLPTGFNETLWQSLYQADSLYWNGQYGYNLTAAKIMNNFFIQQMATYFRSATKGSTNGRKWVMYSAHDTNIANLQYIFNITNFNCLYEGLVINKNFTETPNCQLRPNFAASVIVELWNVTDTFLGKTTQEVKIKYNGEYVNVLNSSSQYMELESFLSKLQIYTYATNDEFIEACGYNKTKSGDIFETMAFMDTDIRPQQIEPINLVQVSAETADPEEDESGDYQLVVLGEVLGIALLTFVLYAMRKSDLR